MSINIKESDDGILGKEERVDQLLEWSMQGKVGDRFVKDFNYGLRLGFVRNNANPKVYIYWNQNKFNKFMSTVGELDSFCVVSYGVEVKRANGQTLVTLLGDHDTSQVLWDTETIEFSRQQENEDVNWVAGMLTFSDDGPVFMTQPDTQNQLEECTAVAIINTKKTEKKAVLPKNLVKQPTGLSNRAAAYLAQDLLSSL